MYGRPMIWLPAQMIAWMLAGAPMGAAARPSTKRAVLPGTSSSGRCVGPVAEVMPSPLISSVGMAEMGLDGVAETGAAPPVALAAEPVVVVPALVLARKGTTSPVAVFSKTGPL